MASPRGEGACASAIASISGSICAQRYDGQRPAMPLAAGAGAKRAAERNGRATVSSGRRCSQGKCGPMSSQAWRGRLLRHKGRVPRCGGPGRRVHGGQRQLALAFPSRSEPILSADGRAVTLLGDSDILEGDGAFDVLAGEHGRVLPLYEHPDVRSGHGTGDRRRGCRCVGSSSAAVTSQHGACRTWAWRKKDGGGN